MSLLMPIAVPKRGSGARLLFMKLGMKISYTTITWRHLGILVLSAIFKTIVVMSSIGSNCDIHASAWNVIDFKKTSIGI